MAGWMKMPLGVEIDFDPGIIVLDGVPVSPKKGHRTPTFPLITGSIARSATCRYLIYSEADF